MAQEGTDAPESRARLLGNAAANGLAFVAQLAVSFVLAPLLVHYLGRERYGVWSFIESFLAYFTLFDLGIAATLVRYVPKCRAEGDSAQLNRVVSTCLLVFSVAGLAVLVVGAGVFALVLTLSPKIPAELQGEAARLAGLSLVALAITLPLTVYPAMMDGLHCFRAKSIIRTAFLLVRVGGTLGVIYFEQGLVALAGMVAGCTIGEHLAMSWWTRRLLPDLHAAPWRADRATLRLIRGYSVDSFLAMLAGRISFKTDAIVIGLCGQLDLIPFFDMPARLVEAAKNLIRSGATTLTPAFSALEAKGGLPAIRTLFLDGCRIALYFVLPIQLALLFFGGPFLELWLRDSAYRVQGGPVLWSLAAVLGFAMLQSVAARVLYGMGRIRGFARLMLLEAVINLGLSIALIGPLGLLGVALGTALPNLVMCIVILIQVCRLLSVDARSLRRALQRPVLAAICVAPLWLALAQILPPVTRSQFAALILLGVLAFSALALVLEGRVWPKRWRKRQVTDLLEKKK